MKPREPLSVEQALCDVIAAISMERAAEVTGRTPGYLRSLSDPDQRAALTCWDAVLLDAEHDILHGTRPITDTMRLKIDARRPANALDGTALIEATIISVKEGGEAHAAMIAAAVPSATYAAKRAAMRELLQSINAAKRAVPVLRAMLRRQPQAP